MPTYFLEELLVWAAYLNLMADGAESCKHRIELQDIAALLLLTMIAYSNSHLLIINIITDLPTIRLNIIPSMGEEILTGRLLERPGTHAITE